MVAKSPVNGKVTPILTTGLSEDGFFFSKGCFVQMDSGSGAGMTKKWDSWEFGE
jgi:hypothetical protein